jgi:putative tricarboxylic transport membrane protein
MRIPGEASSVMTCIDGHAMAKKGRAGAALCIAAVGSWIAGTFGVVVLTVVAPPLATLAVKFGPPEYTALLILGLIFLAYMSSSSLTRTLLMACLGLLLGMIGIDNMTGHFRYSFDLAELGDGIGIVPVAVGLFGLGEILSTPSTNVVGEVIQPKLRDLLPNRREWREAAFPIARGTVLGFIIGIIPGSAHVISSFLSYALEKRVSRHPEEFGKGAVAGVAGPESANNSASTGAFVPMLALGIPTSPITAVLIGALMLHGVSVGPTLVNDHPDVFWGFVASMYVGNLMLLALNLPLVSVFVTVLRIPYAYLYPLIIMFCVIGVYEVNNSVVDVWIMLIMGVLGYWLRKFNFDPAPLVLGLVISPILEQSLRQSLIMSNGDYMIFFQRPMAAGLLGVAVFLLALAALALIRARADWRTKLAEAEAGEAEA